MSAWEHDDWAVSVPVGYVVGSWRVTSGIATGSWGAVYAADRISDDGRLPHQVALKFLPTGTLTPRVLAVLRSQVEREQQARASLRHHHVIETYEVLVIDDADQPTLDGSTVVVMERAAGTLQSLIEEHAPRPVPDAPRLLLEVADALAHIHQRGWVHADIKPSNVLLAADGSVRVTDFGLAAQLDGTHGYMLPIGSPDYLPPESGAEEITVRGRPIRPSADVWAFGVIAFQLLTGRRPFAGDTPAARARTASRYARGETSVLHLDTLPPDWRGIVVDCLDPSPDRRRALDFAQIVRRIHAIPAPRPSRRSAGPLVAVAVLLTLCLVTAVAVYVARSTVSTTAGVADPARSAPSPTPNGQATAQAPGNPSGELMPTSAPTGWRQVYADDFTGSALTISSKTWAEPYHTPKDPSKELWLESHVVVENGMLQLKTYRDPESGRWASGGVFAVGAAKQTYARYHARIRIDASDCVRYSLVLFQTDKADRAKERSYAIWAADEGGERQSLHGSLNIGNRELNRHQNVVDLTKWHTVGIIWTEGLLRYTLDGRTWAEDTGSNVPRHEHTFVAQTEHNEGSSDCRPAALQVDWLVVQVQA